MLNASRVCRPVPGIAEATTSGHFANRDRNCRRFLSNDEDVRRLFPHIPFGELLSVGDGAKAGAPSPVIATKWLAGSLK